MNEKELIQISPHIWALPFNEKTDRPYLYYIKGDEKAIALDCGNSKRHIAMFYDALKAKGFNLPYATYISHWHWDHTFGICGAKTRVISTKATYEILKKVQQWKWDEKSMKERLNSGEEIEFCDSNIRKEYPDRKEISVVLPDETIESDETLQLGNLEVQILLRPSTHTDDALYVYVKADGALLLQDSDCPDYYQGENYDPTVLKRMIAFLQELDYEKHCLGHAEYLTKNQALSELKAYLKVNLKRT